jgi:hypothetical protein
MHMRENEKCKRKRFCRTDLAFYTTLPRGNDFFCFEVADENYMSSVMRISFFEFAECTM